MKGSEARSSWENTPAARFASTTKNISSCETAKSSQFSSEQRSRERRAAAMPPKQILFDEKARRATRNGIATAAKGGAITGEEAKVMEPNLEGVAGMQCERGYLSPSFVTDPERMECVLEN